MRRMFALFLGGLALAYSAGSARAQETVIPTTETRGPIASVLQTSCGAGACCAPACPTTCKTCVAVPDKKIVNHTVFASKCIDYCLPKCPGFFESLRHRGSCASCNTCGTCASGACPAPSCPTCASCGHVRTKHVLLKRVVTCEEDAFKCVVTERPPCVPACAPPCGAPVGPIGEPIPAPKGKTMPPAGTVSIGGAPVAVTLPAAPAAAPVALPAVPAALAPGLPSAGPVTVIPNP
ncbi:MAG: hypothetical protein U0793_17250 [Gemmataceae bacterium]